MTNTNTEKRTDWEKISKIDRVFNSLDYFYENILTKKDRQLSPARTPRVKWAVHILLFCTGTHYWKMLALKHHIQDLIDAREILLQYEDASSVKFIFKLWTVNRIRFDKKKFGEISYLIWISSSWFQ